MADNLVNLPDSLRYNPNFDIRTGQYLEPNPDHQRDIGAYQDAQRHRWGQWKYFGAPLQPGDIETWSNLGFNVGNAGQEQRGHELNQILTNPVPAPPSSEYAAWLNRGRESLGDIMNTTGRALDPRPLGNALWQAVQSMGTVLPEGFDRLLQNIDPQAYANADKVVRKQDQQAHAVVETPQQRDARIRAQQIDQTRKRDK